MKEVSKWWWAFFCVACQFFLCFGTDRAHFLSFITAFSLAFMAYTWIIYRVKTLADVHFFLALGLILRGGCLFCLPNLSDDVYRFIWDGRIWYAGGNPFDHTPQYYIDAGLYETLLTPDLFSKLNSPQYHTVYPPVCQAFFAGIVWLSPYSILNSLFLLKIALFLGECLTLFVLYKYGSRAGCPPKNTLIYALNPLIIIEIVGNIHFEGLLFLGLAILLCALSVKSPSWQHVGIALGTFLAIATKILPLMFLPYLPRQIGWQQSLKVGFTLLVCLFFAFLPLYSPVFMAHLSQSMGLYFGKFEFNASLYYIWKVWHEYLYGYNMPTHFTRLWSIFTLIFILRQSFFRKKSETTEGGAAADYLWAAVVYFLGATTVHPWYATWLVGLSAFTPWRFPVFWSWAIAWTYSGYKAGTSVHTEQMWVLILEYGLTLIFFFMERKKQFFNIKNDFWVKIKKRYENTEL